MITTLTEEQQKRITDERKRYFDLATYTDPADRPKAEMAVRELAEIAGVKINHVVWVNSPEEGQRRCEEAWSEFRSTLDSTLYSTLDSTLYSTLYSTLRSTLRSTLDSTLYSTLYSTLDSTLYSTPLDTGWLAFFAVPRDILGIVYAKEEVRKLDLWIQMLESCFAAWIVPGTAILCERPETVEIKDGNLVGLAWRTADVLPDLREGVLRLLAGINPISVVSAYGGGPHRFADPVLNLRVHAVWLGNGLWCARWCPTTLDGKDLSFADGDKQCCPWTVVDPRPYAKEAE